MAENYEYKEILSEMLAEVPDDLDKREGSIIYNTLAPAAVLIAQQNYQLGYLFNLLFADTATDIWLDRVVQNQTFLRYSDFVDHYCLLHKILLLLL